MKGRKRKQNSFIRMSQNQNYMLGNQRGTTR